MDITTLLLGIVPIAIFIVPGFLLYGARRRKERRARQAFAQRAQQQGLTVSECDAWGGISIALDRSSRRIYYHRRGREREYEVLVPLDDFRLCRVVNGAQGARRAHDPAGLSKRIALEFTPRQAKCDRILLDFFNYDSSLMPDGELQRAERWAGMVNPLMAR